MPVSSSEISKRPCLIVPQRRTLSMKKYQQGGNDDNNARAGVSRTGIAVVIGNIL